MSQHGRMPKYGDYQKQTNNTFVGSRVCAKISIFREQGKHSFFEIRKSLINVQIVQIHILYVFDYDIFGCLLLKLLFQPASYQERGNSYCNFFFNFIVIISVLYKRMVPTIYVDSNPLLHILSHSSKYTYFLSSGPHGFTFLGGYDLSFLSLCRNKLIIHSYALAHPIDQCNGTVRGLPRSDCNSNTQTQLDDQRIHLNNSLHAVRLIFLRQKGTANHEGHRME